MLSSFQKFAEKFKIEVERAIKAELSKRSFLERIGFRIFTPLTVNIVTNQGAASLTVLQDGSVQLSQHLSPNPDSTIQADFETLEDIYSKRDRTRFNQAEAEGRIKITSYSPKGQQAERKLRELLGH